MIAPGLLLKRAAPFALALAIWFTPLPAGLTAQQFVRYVADLGSRNGLGC
jgi:hypothetical protein